MIVLAFFLSFISQDIVQETKTTSQLVLEIQNEIFAIDVTSESEVKGNLVFYSLIIKNTDLPDKLRVSKNIESLPDKLQFKWTPLEKIKFKSVSGSVTNGLVNFEIKQLEKETILIFEAISTGDKFVKSNGSLDIFEGKELLGRTFLPAYIPGG